MKRLLYLTLLLAISYSAAAQPGCNEADLLWMAENPVEVQTAATDCGTECLFAADPDACMVTCMQLVTPLTVDCIGCFSAQVSCIVDNCFFPCALGIGDCVQCATDNCLAPFQECAGIVDIDGDGFTNLTDCDDNDFNVNPDATEIWYDGVDQDCDGLSDFDQDGDGEDAFEFGGLDCNDLDPGIILGSQIWYTDADQDGYGEDGSGTLSCVQPPNTSAIDGDCDDSRNDVHPDAEGTHEGIDNDCNGVVEGDELDCLADFNLDNLVNTSDLLIFLGEFGCEVNCNYDLTDDGVVNTQDLLAFLAAFGQPC
jgi:hypothetical protein